MTAQEKAMKLSEILKDWPEEHGHAYKSEKRLAIDSIYTSGYNTALTSCDREIDREALAKVLYGLKSFFKNPHHYSLKEQAKMSEDDVEKIISTMPTWLKPTERK